MARGQGCAAHGLVVDGVRSFLVWRKVYRTICFSRWSCRVAQWAWRTAPVELSNADPAPPSACPTRVCKTSC